MAENGTCRELEEGLTKTVEFPVLQVECLAESAMAAVLGLELEEETTENLVFPELEDLPVNAKALGYLEG